MQDIKRRLKDEHPKRAGLPPAAADLKFAIQG
jgi:hypothetical protein